MRITTIVHERVSSWGRQLRPRLVDRPVRFVETRSTEELEDAAIGSACPIVVIVVPRRVRGGLEALSRLRGVAPGALCLVVEAPPVPGFAAMARELSASLVLASPTLPPDVMSWLDRWIPLALARSRAAGWSEDARTDPEPWEALLGTSPIA